jgi:hypothetical protein
MPAIFPTIISSYELWMQLDNGCVTISSDVKGKSVEERNLTFKDRVYNFLQIYILSKTNNII